MSVRLLFHFFHIAESIKNNKVKLDHQLKGGRVLFQRSNMIAFLSQEGDGDTFEKVACRDGSVWGTVPLATGLSKRSNGCDCVF